MKLYELTKRLPGEFTIYGDENTEISGLCTDSRKVCRGGVYFCIVGMHSDAHDYATQMQANGAAALVVERRLDIALPQIKVSNVREAMSYIAASFYSYPSDKLKLIGITGTKGKTTTSFMLKSILEAAGHKTGLIGTVCTLIGDTELEAGKTTPDPVEFQKILNEMVNAGVEYAVMEVSAHALDMHRIDGIRLLCAGFTNLSQDHLDYFGTMDRYLEAKLRISALSGSICVNVDDERVAKAFEARKISFTRVGIRERRYQPKDSRQTSRQKRYKVQGHIFLPRSQDLRLCVFVFSANCLSDRRASEGKSRGRPDGRSFKSFEQRFDICSAVLFDG